MIFEDLESGLASGIDGC